jgi:hypothetical protein
MIIRYCLDMNSFLEAKAFYQERCLIEEDILDSWFYGDIWFFSDTMPQNFFFTECKLLRIMSQFKEFLTISRSLESYSVKLYDMEQLYEITLHKIQSQLVIETTDKKVKFDYRDFQLAFFDIVGRLVLEVDLLCPLWASNEEYNNIKNALFEH